MDEYNPLAIEAKWQNAWEENRTNQFTEDELRTAEKPYYNLMMFPYPSAEGLHIGNMYAYTGADVHGRYQRLKGKDVFEPMGFDAFGIHSENFALRRGIHPSELIPSNISNFARQLKRIGGMFDWDHAVDTTDPNYYKWTQWVFIQLFKAGLVERRVAPVNWCPSCMTVVANEQVIDGQCERCDSTVTQKQLPQWFFRITEYSQRLLDNLKNIDWSDHTKKAQQNWIGRSEGAEIDFRIVGSSASIRVFTTRPDTLCGATYMVLAPEHELVRDLATRDRGAIVDRYINAAESLDLKARKMEDREKTGVWTGSYCVNPITQKQIPIWVSDYVLIEYGTGAIMAVPGHDERDFEFALKFDLPIRRVIAGEGDDAATPLEQAYVHDGCLVNSHQFDGLSVTDGKTAIVEHLAKAGQAKPVVNYRLHDWCISRQRYWGPPIPIVHCEDCGAIPVKESELPVMLPELDDYKPDESGKGPLTRAREWVEVSCPECGNDANRETDVSDTFLDSAWYFLRYPCTDSDEQAIDSDLVKKWLPVDCYIGGQEHAVLHLLYSRFICMALSDLGLIEFEEPFTIFRAHGLLIKDGRKISKSRGNIVVPDDLIEKYGADTLRVYLMFLGPFEQGGDYRGEGIQGPHAFLRRLWQTVSATTDGAPDSQVVKQLHRTIEKVSNGIENLRFNLAIAAMMEYLNVVRDKGREFTRQEVEPLVTLVAPFAPHLAEELYQRLGHERSIFESNDWPEHDPEMLIDDVVSIGVQINGKMRGSIEIGVDATEEEALNVAQSHENVSRYIHGTTIRKVIYVPGRILNMVVG